MRAHEPERDREVAAGLVHALLLEQSEQVGPCIRRAHDPAGERQRSPHGRVMLIPEHQAHGPLQAADRRRGRTGIDEPAGQDAARESRPGAQVVPIAGQVLEQCVHDLAHAVLGPCCACPRADPRQRDQREALRLLVAEGAGQGLADPAVEGVLAVVGSEQAQRLDRGLHELRPLAALLGRERTSTSTIRRR